jgi:RNA polymerase sigma factor (sigma-70 family)
MRYPEKLIEGGEVVALDAAKPPPAEMLSVLSHCLPSLYRYAYRLLGNKADAEDAVQDALLAAYKHLNQFRGDAQLSTWLTTIVINCARMHLCKRSRYIHVSLDSRIGEEREYPLSDTLVDHRPNPEDECHKAWANARLIESAARLSPIFAENVSPAVCESSFSLRNSSCSGSSHRNCESANSPRASETAESDARTAPPGPSGTKILLAQASTPEQSSRARNQTGDRVFLFPHTDDFWRDDNALTPRGKKFVRAQEQYGTAAVFENLYPNK